MKEDKIGDDDGGTWQARTAKGVSGAFAASMGTLLGHPLEILKIRLQVRRDLRETRWPTWNMTKELAKLDRPLTHFYRGITANAAGSGVSWALFWPLKSAAENFIRTRKANPTSDEIVPLTFSDTFWATACSSFAIQLVSNPIWVVKTRMLGTQRDEQGAYSNTKGAISSIYRVEGFKTFYSGFWISVFGIAQGGLQFVVYDHMRDWMKMRQRQAKNIAEGSDADRLSALNIGIVSATSKTISISVFYPYQTIRSRMQMPNALALYGDGVRGVAQQLYREGKFRAFYKGLGPAIARNLPATCASFLIYEKVYPHLTELLGAKKGGGRREP